MAEAKQEENEYANRSLALIKPNAFKNADKIIKIILENGFKIVAMKQVKLTGVLVDKFYAIHAEKGWYKEEGGLRDFMQEGPIIAIMLEKEANDKGEVCYKQWRNLIGPTKREENSKDEYKDTIRYQFAEGDTRNACHGSDEADGEGTIQRECDFFFKTQQTYAMIKPDAVANGKVDDIIARIEAEGFLIIDRQSIVLTEKRAREFYDDLKDFGFFEGLIKFMTEPAGVVALKLERQNAIAEWRNLIGPTKYGAGEGKDFKRKTGDEIKAGKGKNGSTHGDQCLRMLFGTDLTRNACHGSDALDTAANELNFFFPLSETLGLIKPDVVEAGKVDEVIQDIINKKFNILEIKQEQLTKERAEAFYAEHKGKGFFDNLVKYMTSGPLYAMKLQKGGIIKTDDDQKDQITEIKCFKQWRDFMGATDPTKAEEGTLRKKYGKNLDANATHGSDSDESAKRELEFFFPATPNKPRDGLEYTLALIKPDAVRLGYEAQIVARIKYDGFVIRDRVARVLKEEEVREFYSDLKDFKFFPSLVDFMTEKEYGDDKKGIIAMKVERATAIQGWRNLIGPTKYGSGEGKDFKRKSDEEIRSGKGKLGSTFGDKCLRMLYGTNMTKNACHGSDAVDTAENELNFYFGKK